MYTELGYLAVVSGKLMLFATMSDYLDYMENIAG